MEYVTLGRTGLRASVAGLGCGGFSQLGLAQGKTEDDAIAIIRQAVAAAREAALKSGAGGPPSRRRTAIDYSFTSTAAAMCSAPEKRVPGRPS
jgi:hypothetical protein